ncbi:MAG: hypothetical protein JOY68_08260, partial [Candidatus Dormibacteraeota bacterium]|nr:hypothetical protein [Candidatus Dormibacteraeota bacterium]
AVRFIVVFVVVALPVLAWQWTPAWVRFTVWLRESGRLTAGVASLRSAGLVALVVIAAGCVGFAGYTLRGQTASTDANYPVAAAGWLASHPACGTRMFNQYDWGGYLANRFYPSVNRRVFIYGEAELMGDQLLAEYVDVNQLHSDWEQVLDEHGVDYVVFAPDRPVDAALQASGLWTLQYSDSVADIFVRDTALAGCGGA